MEKFKRSPYWLWMIPWNQIVGAIWKNSWNWNRFRSRFDFTEKSVWIFTVEKTKIHCHDCHANFFPSNQLLVMFFSKTLIWRNFSVTIVAVKFRNFHSVNIQSLSSLIAWKKSRQNALISRNWHIFCTLHYKIQITIYFT